MASITCKIFVGREGIERNEKKNICTAVGRQDNSVLLVNLLLEKE